MEREDLLATEEPWLRDAVLRLRERVPRSPGVVDAVLLAAGDVARLAASTDPPAALRAGYAESRRGGQSRQPLWSWLTWPRIRLSPLAAAVMILTLVASTLSIARWQMRKDVGSAGVLRVTNRHQFVLVAPQASSVALVGDFNAWNLGATPLERQGAVWTVELSLPPGRHIYAFVVDGEKWVPDASAPRAPEDEFGRPNSVLLIPERGT